MLWCYFLLRFSLLPILLSLSLFFLSLSHSLSLSLASALSLSLSLSLSVALSLTLTYLLALFLSFPWSSICLPEPCNSNPIRTKEVLLAPQHSSSTSKQRRHKGTALHTSYITFIVDRHSELTSNCNYSFNSMINCFWNGVKKSDS